MLERSSINLRPWRSATRPQTGEAKAAMNEVTPLRTPAHRSTAPGELTPSSGRKSGMIGLSIENAIVITNWMPTIAHRVRRHCAGSLSAVSAIMATPSSLMPDGAPVAAASHPSSRGSPARRRRFTRSPRWCQSNDSVAIFVRAAMPEHEFDLIAIGGGFAGLVATLRGAELGLRTAVLEQGGGAHYLCSSRYAGGVFHVSYHDVRLPPAELAAAIANATGGEADPTLAEAVAADARRVVDWLTAQGAQFTQGSASNWHRFVLAPPRAAVAGPDWVGRGPDLLLARLGDRLRQRGGQILLETRARALRLEGGRCVGVTAEQAGQTADFAAASVVVADGGFPADPELFRRYIGPRPDRVLQRHAGTARGDGLRMAQEAGAAVLGLDRFYGHLLSRGAMTNGRLWPYPQIDAVAAAGIVVDTDGRRIVNEGLGGIAIANALARLADPLCATVVCDAPIWESAGRAHQNPAQSARRGSGRRGVPGGESGRSIGDGGAVGSGSCRDGGGVQYSDRGRSPQRLDAAPLCARGPAAADRRTAAHCDPDLHGDHQHDGRHRDRS